MKIPGFSAARSLGVGRRQAIPADAHSDLSSLGSASAFPSTNGGSECNKQFQVGSFGEDLQDALAEAQENCEFFCDCQNAVSSDCRCFDDPGTDGQIVCECECFCFDNPT